MIVIRRPYEGHCRVITVIDGPSMTKQSFKQECDINHILARYKKQAGMDFLNQYQGYLEANFGDASTVVDYRTAHEQINEARGVFEAMPATLRKRFDNDPAQFLSFMSNTANETEARSLGLLNPLPEKQVELH